MKKAILLFVCLSLWLSSGVTLAQDSVDINGSDVVPRITFPRITQSDFQHAFNVLQGCVVTRLPVYGFTHPFMYPGGLYDKWWYEIDSVNVLGATLPCKPYFEKFWWELDGSLTLSGAKWANEEFAENVMRNFIAVQRPDGRIPLFAPDTLIIKSKVSAFPTLFEIGHAIARRTSDAALVRSIFNCLKKYLDWWLLTRRDKTTGLITGVFEESLPSDEGRDLTRAPVDLNSEIVIGCENVARLAKHLGDMRDYRKYTRIESEIKDSMNKYMWADSAYYSYNVRDRHIVKRLLCNTFYPLEDNIARGNRVKRLLELLTDNRYFNWDQNPVTTASKMDPSFNEIPGVYNGRQWLGDVWSMKNVAIIHGLEDVGRYDLAAYLSYKTAMEFNNNCSEFIIPSSGLGQGQLDYGLSASQYIQIIVEKIFGVDYDNFNNTITIMPRLAAALRGHDIALDSLRLPDGNRLDLEIQSSNSGDVRIKYQITGEHRSSMEVGLALPDNSNVSYRATGREGKPVKLSTVKKGAARIYQYDCGQSDSGMVDFMRGENP